MTALSVQPPFPILTDIDGQPLDDGFIFIGVANNDPIANPITVYWDAALTVTATQPLRTRGGYPMNAGVVGRLYVNSDYSIQVQNRNGSTVYSSPVQTERFGDVVVITNAGVVLPTPDVNGQAWWSTDTPRGQDLYLEGRMFAGAAATYPGIDLPSPPPGWLEGWMVRDASNVTANPHGGIAGSFHSRNGDTLRPPITGLASTVSVWAAGQSIVIGNLRGWNGVVYSATNNGTTAAPPPTHFSGTSPDGGGVLWSVVTTRGAFFATIGLLSRVRSEIIDGEGTWVQYIEGVREATGGVVFGMEVGLKNKGSDVVLDSFQFLQEGATIGGWYAAGADASYDGAPTAPTTAHIVMGRNSTTANQGILFAHNAFTPIGGRQRAIGLGPTQAIQWWAAAGRLAFEIRSDGADAGRELRIEQVGSGAALDFSAVRTTGQTEPIYRFIQPDLSVVGSRANQILFNTAYAGGGGPGSITLQGEGPDTNIDMILIPKGTGVIRYQIASTAAGTPASFSAARYIPIKDSSGTIYYIPLATATW